MQLLARHLVVAWASLCLLTACGGGGTDTAAPAPSPHAEAGSTAAWVQIEGCVASPGARPLFAGGVRAVSEDGRLLATAHGTADGVFVLQVPAHRHLRVGLDAPGEETIALLTGSNNVSLGGCLRPSAA